MLKTDSKVYYVYDFGGEYEDAWEQAIGVCSTLELANKLKEETEAKRQECPISETEYDEMLDYLYAYERDHGYICDNEIDGLIKLFPKYSADEIKTASDKYYSEDFVGIGIMEIDFYN